MSTMSVIPRVNGVKDKLLDLIKTQGQVSVDEATEQLALSKTTVRQHLLTMERQGLIERQFRRLERGRPQLTYAISEEGARLYPSSDPKLLKELLIHLLKTGQENTVKTFFQQFWTNRRKQFESRLAGEKDKSTENRLRILTQILEEEGFMPKVECLSSKHLAIRECNCPYSEAVKATTIPCKLEAEFIQAAVGQAATRVTYIPSGASACSYEFIAERRSGSGPAKKR